MNPIYKDTKFYVQEKTKDWPEEFAIITAYATTGEEWTNSENELADTALMMRLKNESNWLKRITGFSPETRHAEPGWAVSISWENACDIGLEFKQDAIYYVSNNRLTVSYCDDKRKPIDVDEFSWRVSIIK